MFVNFQKPPHHMKTKKINWFYLKLQQVLANCFKFLFTLGVSPAKVPHGEQAPPSSTGEERHEGLPRSGWQRGILVLHPAVLQVEEHGR